MSLSAEDDVELSMLGSIVAVSFIGASIDFIAYGLYLLLFPASILIMRRGAWTWGRVLIAVATTLLFLSTTIIVASEICFNIVSFRAFFVNPGLPISLRTETIKTKYGVLIRLMEVCEVIDYILGDMIVIWRAWHLYVGNRPVRSFILVQVLANIGLFVFWISDPKQSGRLAVVYPYFSVFTNLCGTSLIAYRAYEYLKQIHPALGGQRTKVHKVFLALLETGFIFLLLQLLNAIATHIKFISNSESQPLEFLYRVISSFSYMSAAIFPTLIIIIVGRENNHLVERSNTYANSGSGSIAFDVHSGRGTRLFNMQFASSRVSEMNSHSPVVNHMGNQAVAIQLDEPHAQDYSGPNKQFME